MSRNNLRLLYKFSIKCFVLKPSIFGSDDSDRVENITISWYNNNFEFFINQVINNRFLLFKLS